MLVKNNAGKDAVWEAEQRGNEDLVGWLLGYGEEKSTGEVTVEDTNEAMAEDDPNTQADTNALGSVGDGFIAGNVNG